jgi:hypothetical protein
MHGVLKFKRIFRRHRVNYCNVQKVDVFHLFLFDGECDIGNGYIKVVESSVYISELGVVYQ